MIFANETKKVSHQYHLIAITQQRGKSCVLIRQGVDKYFVYTCIQTSEILVSGSHYFEICLEGLCSLYMFAIQMLSLMFFFVAMQEMMYYMQEDGSFIEFRWSEKPSTW